MYSKQCIIAIEGTDGSGKETQVELLKMALENFRKSVKVVDFPVYTDYFGKEIGNKLKDGSISSLDPKSIALWYAVDRARVCKNINEDEYCYEMHDYIIFNRSTVSNMVYQMCRCKDENEAFEIGKWIYEMERKQFSIPFPNIVFILDIDLLIYKRSIMRKRDRDYLGSQQLDANESNDELIINTMNMYGSFSKYLYKIDPEIKNRTKVIHINCINEHGRMKSKTEICDLIVQQIIALNIIDKISCYCFSNFFGWSSQFINYDSEVIKDGRAIEINISKKDYCDDNSEKV